VNPETLITALNTQGVKYVIVGGFAAVLQGARYVTYDVDFCWKNCVPWLCCGRLRLT